MEHAKPQDELNRSRTRVHTTPPLPLQLHARHTLDTLSRALQPVLQTYGDDVAVVLLPDGPRISKEIALVVVPDELGDSDLTDVEQIVELETHLRTGQPCEVLLYTWTEYEEREDWELGFPINAWPAAQQIIGPPLLTHTTPD